MLAIAQLLGFTIGASLSGLIFRFVGQNAEIAALVLGAILAACTSAIRLSQLKKQHAEAPPRLGNRMKVRGGAACVGRPKDFSIW